MATENTQEDSVVHPGSIDHPERRILLTESEPTTKLGRSSSRPSLGLQPAVSNGWYNSPVMSRHHAELEADFANETVGVRDLGSMHGTFLNKNKVGSHTSQPARIRVGDELTLGLPVFRNREEFQPALVRVDGLEFREASRRPTTTPTRTFTVPDDCSTDDNEPLDEPMDEPLVMTSGTRSNVGLVDDEAAKLVSAPNPWIDSCSPLAEGVAQTCQSNAGPSHQLDGADDNSASGGALPRPYITPGVCCDLSSNNGSLCCSESDRAEPNMFLDDLTDSDEDDDSLNDIESANDHDVQNANHGDESRSASWNSFSSDSEDDHMEIESVLDESASEGLALFDDDSDEIAEEVVVERKAQHDTGLGSEQQTVHSPQAASRDVEINRAPVLPSPIPQLPPISSVISAGPNDWMSCSHSNWGPRSPSPSDAVLLPRHCRTDAAGSERAQGDVRHDTSDRVVSESKELNVHDDLPSGNADFDDLTPLGQRSGKAEFFAARAVNKKVHDANLQIERLYEAAPRPSFGSLHISPTDRDEAVRSLPPSTTAAAADSSPGFVLAAHVQGLTGEKSGHTMVHQTEPVGPRCQSHYGIKSPYNVEAAAWSSFDPDSHEPSSAYELQTLKQRVLAETPLGESLIQTVQAPTNVYAAGSAEADTSAAISYTFEQLEHQRQELDEQAVSVGTMDKHAARKGKRKAKEISEESPIEVRWNFSSSEVKSKDASSAEALPSSSHHLPRSTSTQLPLPSPPPSPEEVASLEQRPTKKIKKIAERVGYAALGGVSVGAMVLTSLIYTAPSFV